jgi:acetyl esterase
LALKLEKMLGVRPVVALAGTPTENRQVLEAGCAQRDALLPTYDDVITHDEKISVGEADIQIDVRIYKRSGTSTADKLPVAVFYHGGGWALGSIAADNCRSVPPKRVERLLTIYSNVVFCKELVHDTGHIAVSVEYRLSPEAQFPKPLDDSYAALLWVGPSLARRYLAID